jgi:hypothetical protein
MCSFKLVFFFEVYNIATVHNEIYVQNSAKTLYEFEINEHLIMLEKDFYQKKNTPDRIFDVDVFAIYYLFHFIAYQVLYGRNLDVTQYEQHNETYIALWCAGAYDNECRAPTITQVRKHEFYSDIDFMKLLLRGYNLVDELKFDINEMFKQYSEADEQRLFGNETRYMFLRRNDPKILNEKNPKILQTFPNI